MIHGFLNWTTTRKVMGINSQKVYKYDKVIRSKRDKRKEVMCDGFHSGYILEYDIIFSHQNLNFT